MKLLLLISELIFLTSPTKIWDILSFNADVLFFWSKSLYTLPMRGLPLMASFQMYHSAYSV